MYLDWKQVSGSDKPTEKSTFEIEEGTEKRNPQKDWQLKWNTSHVCDKGK